MEQVLILTRVFYVGVSIGVLAFFLLWEDGKPKIPFSSTRDRNRHVLRNLAMFAWVIFIADYVIGQGLLHAHDFLVNPPRLIFNGSFLPVPIQIIIAFLASDFLGYWMHRAAHRFNWFWRLHAVHHSDPHLDATTATRTHPLEISIDVAGKIGLYIALGFPLWIEGIRAIIHNALAMIQHANVTFPSRIESLRPVFVTPAMHRVHHETERALHDSNFGVIFSFWDRIFGTYIKPETVVSHKLGLEKYSKNKWQTVTGMLLSPFFRHP